MSLTEDGACMSQLNRKFLQLPLLGLAFLALIALAACRGSRRSTASSDSWTKATILAQREDHPSKIVADGESVYFITGGTIASQRDGTNNVKAISLKDRVASILVKGGDLIPDEMLYVDQKYVYWSDGGNILRVPKGGGASEKIIPNAAKPDELVMDDDNFYWLMWTGEGSPPQPIMYAAKKGGEAKQLTPPQPPTSGLCVAGDFVFFMTGDGIKKVSKRGGEIVEVWHNALKTPSLGLQQDAANFYFTQMNSRGHSSLMKLNKQSGDLKQLVDSINHTMDFIVDERDIYYFDEVPKSGSFGPVALLKVSKQGGEPITLDQGNAGWVKHLAVDSTKVYFTDISNIYALAK